MRIFENHRQSGNFRQPRRGRDGDCEFTATAFPIVRHLRLRVELRAGERPGHTFLARDRRRLHRQRDLNRVGHFCVRFRHRFETNFCRGKIDIVHLRFESKDGGRIARPGLRGAIAADQFATRIRRAARSDLLRVGKVLLHDCAQFDFIAIAQKTRQRGVDKQRLGNLHRRARVAAELVRLRLTDRDDAIRRKIIRHSKIKFRFAVLAGFQTALPKRKRLEFFSHVGHVRDRFFFAAADDKPFFGQARQFDFLDVALERLIAADRKWISAIKIFEDLRQCPVAKFQDCVVHGEHHKIGISHWLAFRSDVHVAANSFARLYRSICEMRLNF